MADLFVDPELLAISEEQKYGTYNVMEDDSEPPKPVVKLEIPGAKPITQTVKDEEMADLFGDDDLEDLSEEEETKHVSAASPSRSVSEEGLSAAELKHRQELEYMEDENPEEAVIELKHAALSIPNIPIPKSSDGNNWVIRMPNFVKLDSKPFHPETYVGPEQDEESLPGQSVREKSMSIKLEVENTMRWRWIKDETGQFRRESNSRIVRWSDGSLSLLLGKELFDINQTVDNSASASRQLGGYGSQSQLDPTATLSQSQSTTRKSQGLTYLVAQHKRSAILQSELAITGYMSLRPTGMQSETHRMLVRAVGQKHNKVARLRMAPDPVMDPEREKIELMKQVAKKGRKMRTSAEDEGKIGGSGRRRRGGASRRRMGMGDSVWSDEDEEHEEGYEGTDEEEGDGKSGGKRAHGRSGESKRGAGEYQNDDFVVADSSEEDPDAEDDSDSPRKSRKRHKSDGGGDDAEGEAVDADADAEGDPDVLDEIDAKIAQQEEDRKRTRAKKDAVQKQEALKKEKESGGVQQEKLERDEDNDMDVESEEEEDDEEEELNIRRAGMGVAKKKKAITIEEEDEDE